MTDIEYKYYRFGSKDSIDIDILIEHPEAKGIENDKKIIDEIKIKYPMTKDWNINIIGFEEGVVSKSIPSKGNPDGVNNSLYETYHLHHQKHSFPLSRKLDRNIDAAIEKCLVAIFTFYKKTNHDLYYKKIPKEYKSSKGELKSRLLFLKEFDFNKIPFENENKNINAFKSISFHLGQTISLIKGIEIYTKQELVYYHPDLLNLIKRQGNQNSSILNETLNKLISSIDDYYQD